MFDEYLPQRRDSERRYDLRHRDHPQGGKEASPCEAAEPELGVQPPDDNEDNDEDSQQESPDANG